MDWPSTSSNDVVADLLCDLMHYCYQKGLSYFALSQQARASFGSDGVTEPLGHLIEMPHVHRRAGKIEAVKAVRAISWCGLKDAKDAVEDAGQTGTYNTWPVILKAVLLIWWRRQACNWPFAGGWAPSGAFHYWYRRNRSWVVWKTKELYAKIYYKLPMP